MKSLSTAQVTVYPCLSFPFSTYEHQFVFRRGNMPGRMYLLDHCDSLPWLLSAFQIPRRHHGQAQAANVRQYRIQPCSIAQSIFVSILNLNQTRCIDIARPELYIYVLLWIYVLCWISTGWFFKLVRPFFSTKMKKLAQPTRSFFTLKISWKTSPGWLQLVFLFGTENWADQLKKTPCI